METNQRMRERLARMRQDILARTGAVQRDLRRTRDRDSEERAIQIENDPVLEQLDDEGRRELQQIDEALARIDAGTYGRCEQCGGRIQEERLEALPFATTCIDCASSEA
jgi:RNA polymerase-binding protein DksA